jgi:NADH-quinone oxidoreductase subunit H
VVPLLRALGVLALLGAGVLFGTQPIPSWLWFFAKTYVLVFVLVWLRGTLPRLRVDQLMGLAWKFLLPLALVNILAAGLWVSYPFPVGTILSVLLLVASWWGLVLANKPAPLQPRTYLFAD